MDKIADIIDIIWDYITKEKEDAHLDFKEKWHSDFCDLLKDIISMANSSDELNSYIVVGISDDYKVVGINKKEKRYTKADISSSIRNYNFAGNSVPEIDLFTIYIERKEIDVLEVKNTNSVPFYLKTRTSSLRPYVIYTRANDANKEATFEECEKLWKKRFNLLLSESDRFKKLLENPDDWNEYNGEYYYKFDASFRIKLSEFSDKKHPPFYAYIVDDWGRFDTKNAILSHNGNEIASYQLAYLDGCRLEFAVPENFFIRPLHGASTKDYIGYRGYIRNTLKINLANFFYDKNKQDGDCEYICHFDRLKKAFVVYETVEEKERFELYISEHYDDFKLKLKDFNPIIYSSTPDQYKEDIKIGMLLCDLYYKKDIWCS